MKLKNMNRRIFLEGCGGYFFAIPFLPSIFRASKAFADNLSAPLRFVVITTPHGSQINTRVPDLCQGNWGNADPSFLTTMSELGIRTGQLPSDISKAGSYYKLEAVTASPSLIDEMLAINGINIHRANIVSGHGQRLNLSGNDNDGTNGPYSITLDQVIANKFSNASDAPMIHSMQLGLYTYGSQQVSVDKNGSDLKPYTLQDAFNTYMQGGAVFPSTDAAAKLLRVRKELTAKSAIDFVTEDRQRLMRNTRLSAEDRSRLDEYLSHFRDLESKFKDGSTDLQCSPYSLPGSFNRQTELRNFIKASFMCDLTRVISIQGIGEHEAIRLNPTYKNAINAELGLAEDNAHNLWHVSHSTPSGLKPHQMMAEQAAYLADTLQRTIDPLTGENMLKNTIILTSHENGGIGPHKKLNSHFGDDTSYLIFGGSNIINTRRMVDTSNEKREPIDGKLYSVNQFLITIMTAMGLQPSDWEASPGSGFGKYNEDGGRRCTTYQISKGFPMHLEKNKLVPGILK